MSPPSEEERFADYVNGLCEAILYTVGEVYRVAPDDAAARQIITPEAARVLVSLVRILGPRGQLDLFIAKTPGCWEKIRVRDEAFFVTAASDFFIDLPGINIRGSMFADILAVNGPDGRRLVQEDVVAEVWDIFQRMVRVAIRFAHRCRDPAPGGYRAAYAEHVDVAAHAKAWGIQLPWPA